MQTIKCDFIKRIFLQGHVHKPSLKNNRMYYIALQTYGYLRGALIDLDVMHEVCKHGHYVMVIGLSGVQFGL